MTDGCSVQSRPEIRNTKNRQLRSYSRASVLGVPLCALTALFAAGCYQTKFYCLGCSADLVTTEYNELYNNT